MTDDPRGLCTCCEPPRLMHLDPAYAPEWCHDDDETYAEVFHVHDDSGSRDCDGPHEHSSVERIPSLGWRDTDPHPDKHSLWTRLARMAAPLHSPCHVTVEAIDDHGLLRLTWSRETDEGWEGGQLTGCDDADCAHDRATQRDYFAEAMNY